ncbi:MAG: sodium/proton-translocating pyrophosphatase, partial [Planctomycetota bacterium]|nr:sodium/proton-translocating pyrophosphatase [Planctomycetota bacterium]
MNVVTLASLPSLYFIAPTSALAALAAAFWLSRKVMSYSEGEPLMIEIAQAVRDGAMAYLKRQYKVVAA